MLKTYQEREELRQQLREAAWWCQSKTGVEQLMAKAVIRSAFEDFLLAAKKAGYKKITVGACRHWRDGCDSMIFAEPKTQSGTWPAVWRLAKEHFGGTACGNGLKEADQCQLDFSLTEFRGEHNL